jgi:hypothetical protein
MTPQHILTLLAVALLGFCIWKWRAKVQASLADALFHVLDAVVVGYLFYLLVSTIFDFGAYQTWTGTARLLFFAGKPTGGQWFGILAGAILGFLRFSQESFSEPKNKSDYVAGRIIWCHNSALIVSNALLAARADREKVSRPQHLDPEEVYEPPEDPSVLEELKQVPDLEKNRALEPYSSKPGEYDTVSWGMIRIPYVETENHFLAVGATGSGKTLMIHALMKTVLPKIKTHPNFRAFVYDDKPDFLPFAKQLELEQYVWNFDPFDANGVAWDMAADVTTYAEAEQVAAVLAPIDPGLHEPYFQQAVQGFLSAVLISFMETCGTNWTLRDVLLAFSSKPRLEKVLNRHPQSIRRSRAFLGANKSLGEVLSTLRTKLGPYEIPAALWAHAKEKRSVRKWHESNAILLVRNREIFSQAVRPINQALFRMASLFLLNQPDSQTRSSWVFLDEIREIGRLEGFHALGNKGRTKGVRLVLGFQSISGMRAEHRDKNAADEIANVCGHRTFLHTDCAMTREWAAGHMGNIVVDETVFSFSKASGDRSPSGVSWQTKREARQSMQASDFDQNLKKVSFENGLTALNTVPTVGTYVSWVPSEWIDANLPRPEEEKTEFRPDDEQKIKDWTQADLKRIGLPMPIDEETKPAGGKPSATRRDQDRR